MKYTLYIDESGDFETQRGQWVLSGVLFSDTYENCEKLLINKLSSVPKQLGCESIKDFHLTEFRQIHGHKTAVSMARVFLDKLNTLPFEYHFLSTINYTKASLSEREKTYRLMVSDLLALCETVIPEDDIIEHLDLIIATRTIDGEAMTWVSDVNKDIIESLPKALEFDLATKGMVELIGNHIKVKLQQANKSWGLVCADFIANLTYNNRNQNEKELFESLQKENRYSLFESFGGYEVRRANIAERDKDYVLALYRWLVLSLKAKDKDAAHKAIQRLFKKVFEQRGTSGNRTAFEALLERLWRNYNSPHLYQQLSSILLFLEDELEIFFSKSQNIQNAIMFRIRNFTMMLENHIGNAEKLNILVDKQNSNIEQLASNPEYFNMILDFKTHEIETKINNLELREASVLSKKYAEMIKNYKECWKLLTEQDELSMFDNSRANIKSEMILIRSSILASEIEENYLVDGIDNKVSEISKLISHPLDISRLNNYKIMYLLRQRKYVEALNFSLSIFPLIETELLNYFDLLWFMKILNDSMIIGKITKFQKYISIVNFQFSQLSSEDKGHPIDLLWRELALFEFIAKNDKKVALKNIKNSKSAFTLGDSAIAHWLKIVTDIHDDYFLDKLKDEEEYFGNFGNTELIESMNNFSDMSLLQKIRYISPY